jgi:molybdopterin molybdotransferase
LITIGNNVSESSLSAKRESVPALVTVANARATMLMGVAVTDDEFVTLDEALGRVLAKPVTASRDQPPFAVSEMDGYAVIAGDTPATLTLVGESSAGHGFAGRLQPGSTIRISTGAAVPAGADAVVIQENVTRDGDRIAVPRAEAGQHVRPQAMDFTAGTRLLEMGRKLDGIALAMAAASGVAKLPVRRRPRVAILSGGDELAEPGATPGPFQIFDSGTHGIAGLVMAWGGVPHRLQLEKDDPAAIARAAERGLMENDILVLVGGASVGDHDHARPALLKLGLEMFVNKVALRPGKPTWFGHALQRPVLGLPGNPASALVCAHLFLRPLLEAMLGRDPNIRLQRARLVDGIPANGDREHYLRAQIGSDAKGSLTVRAFEQQDSSLLSIFAAANALIRLPANAPALDPGALVDVLPLTLPA